MILCNVSRSAGARSTGADLLQAASGDWPLRSGATREDLDQEIGQPVVAIARNSVVGVYDLKAVLALETGRVAFDLQASAAHGRFAGLAAPAGLRYVRGEAWPIKIVDTTESLELLNHAADSAATTAVGPVVETARIGAFTVTIDQANPALLRVTAPRCHDVLVVGTP